MGQEAPPASRPNAGPRRMPRRPPEPLATGRMHPIPVAIPDYEMSDGHQLPAVDRQYVPPEIRRGSKSGRLQILENAVPWTSRAAAGWWWAGRGVRPGMFCFDSTSQCASHDIGGL